MGYLGKGFMEDQYWRELAIKLLGWGIATCFVVIGWTISNGQLFFFCSDQEAVALRTNFINVIVPAVGIAWIFALNKINSEIPVEQAHVKNKPMCWVAVAFLVLTIVILFVSSIYNPDGKCTWSLSGGWSLELGTS